MKMNKKILLLGMFIITGCSLTQPKSPVFNGLVYDLKQPIQNQKAIKNINYFKTCKLEHLTRANFNNFNIQS